MSIYIVQNRVAKTRFSEPIVAANDIVALLGFAQFVRSEESKNSTPKRVYALYRAAKIDEEGRITADENSFVKIANGDEADELYNEKMQEAFEKEESAIVE